MPTDNRRVAAYLPKEIDERLKLFKLERGFTTEEKLGQKESDADSQAVIAILSEFLGVSPQVAHLRSSTELELKQRIELLEERFSQLKDELLGELLVTLESRLPKNDENVDSKISELEAKISSFEQTKAEVKDELLSELKGELSNDDFLHGQLKLLPDSEIQVESKESIPLSELLVTTKDSGNLQPLSERGLARRLKRSGTAIGYQRKKNLPDKLLEWTSAKDPDGCGWMYNEEDELYYPVSPHP